MKQGRHVTKLVMQTNVNRLERLLQSCCVVVLINIIQVSSMEGAEPVSSKKPADVSRPVAAAVTRALPFLWQEGERWIEERGCVSCHQVPLMVWSLSAALERGFPVSKKRHQNHKEWSVHPASFVGPEGEERYQLASAMSGNTDTMSMLLLGLGGNRHGGEEWKKVFSEALLNNQRPNGLWYACGQLPAQKRPLEETNRVSSKRAMLALLRQGYDPRRFNLKSMVSPNTLTVSTEAIAVRLLLLKYGSPTSVLESTKKLLQRQNTDGVLGWISGQASDALATGITLYALRVVGTGDAVCDALGAGDQFLIRTQLEDGSWRVSGTKRKADNAPTETAIYWGTAWAVVGLLER